MDFTSAYNLYEQARCTVRNPCNLGAEELFLTEHKQSDQYVKYSNNYQKYLNDSAKSPLFPNAPVSDLLIMKTHLDLLETFPIDEIIPRGVSLHNSLLIDQTFSLTWKQPDIENHFITKSMRLKEFDITNFNLDTFETTKDAFLDAISTSRSAYFDVQPIPFMMETIKIPAKEYCYLLTGKRNWNSCRISSSLHDDDLIEVPARIIISDGNAMAISLKFGWDIESFDVENNTHHFVYNYGKLQSFVCSFLSDLPFLYAENIDVKLNCLRKFLSDVYDQDIRFRGLDIGALAVAAGCKMDSTDLFSLSSVTLGKPFPVGIENMDQSWALSIKNLPTVVNSYIISKMKLITKIYATMMGSLLRTLFPDPDIVCYALRMSQRTFVSWFSEFIAVSLQHAWIHTDSHKHISRADMIRSIIHPDCVQGEQLADLVINVPVPQCGGERYLHHARDQYFRQSQILKFIDLQDYNSDHPRPHHDILSQRYNLMYKREYVNDDFHLPLECNEDGLRSSPQFKDDLYNFEVDTLTSEYIKDPSSHTSRSRVSAIQEWARLNPTKIPVLMKKLRLLSFDDLKPFWILNVRLYDYLRGVILRVRDERYNVFKLDQVISRKTENTSIHLRSIEAKRSLQSKSIHGNQILLNQQRRVDLCDERSAYLDSESRVDLLNAVHNVIPGDFTARNRRILKRRKQRLQKSKLKRLNFISATQWDKNKKLSVINRIQVKPASLSSQVKPVSQLSLVNPVSQPSQNTKYPQFDTAFNDWCDKELATVKFAGDNEFGDDRDIPLKGLAKRLSQNKFGYETRTSDDYGALVFLIRNRIFGDKKKHDLWRRLRVAEFENRS